MPTMRIRKILLSVAEDGAPAALRRAADLARRANAAIELFGVVAPVPGFLGWNRTEAARADRARAATRLAALEKAAKRLRRAGVTVSCAVEVDADPGGGIARHAGETHPDLVIIEAHRHATLARLLLTYTDFELIRQCPVPLLIVKSPRTTARRPILAALDPWHAAGKPQSLDRAIVEAGRAMAHLLGSKLHTGHVYSPLIDFATDSTFAPVALPISAYESRKYAAEIRRGFRAISTRYRIGKQNAHVREGDPAFVLPELASHLQVGLVVMGAVSRSAVRRLLIGNTAERLLDRLACDVLVVRPAGTA